MSADLDLRVLIPVIDLKSSSSSSSPQASGDIKNEDEDDSTCVTPKSPQHTIPAILICPPAPKKPRRQAIRCKRKLSDELEFFDIVEREQVESFFRTVEAERDTRRINGGASKRRKCVIT